MTEEEKIAAAKAAAEGGKKLTDMTSEEIQADIDAKVASAKAEAEAELAHAKAELEKLGKKDFDFSKMKDGEKALHDRIAGLENQLKEKETREVTGKKKALLDAFAGSDAALRAEIEKNYSTLNLPEGTPEEIETRLKQAFTLATGTRPESGSSRNGMSVSSGRRVSVPNEKVDANLSEFAKTFSSHGYNVSDDDIKKFGNKR